MQNEKLKPCPFCNSQIKKIIGFQGINFFKCQNKVDCGAIVSFDNDYCNFHKEKATKAWNRRAEKWLTEQAD